MLPIGFRVGLCVNAVITISYFPIEQKRNEATKLKEKEARNVLYIIALNNVPSWSSNYFTISIVGK